MDYEINQEKFGAFVSELRKQKNLTQKELAQKLFISDKAVSKWERGLSMPDITLLIPLANLLGVTTTELLSGQHIHVPEQLNVQQVEQLVTGTISLSAKERNNQRDQRRRRAYLYFGSVLLVVFELLILLTAGFSLQELAENLLLIEGLCFFFGGWFLLFVKDTLPSYYDENNIHTYSDGFFRMNMAGIRFSNRNWPYILRVGRLWMLAIPVLFPLLYLLIHSLFSAELWESGKLFFSLIAILGFFIPMIYTAKRHE